MAQRASVTHRLALARAQHCLDDCRVLEARRVTLAARFDALDAQAAALRREEALDDWVIAWHDAFQADPITSRLAVLLDTGNASVDLLSGVLFAGVLEGVACLLWTLALRGFPLPVPVTITTQQEYPTVSPAADATGIARAAVTTATDLPPRQTVAGEVTHAGNGAMVSALASDDDPVTPLPQSARGGDELTQLATEVTAGRVRPTVASIRQHLGCS